ncbi:MAG: hypothetical protein J7L23_04370 [Candidatus Diapherotrites archaeon]|nr:hypothetical protein [Candidatus Diapherotrites archaeon]
MSKPKFVRQAIKKRTKDSWRKPRGIDSEQRAARKHKGAKPRVGYGSPKKIQKEILVRNLKDLEGVTDTKIKIRIRSDVGRKKRLQIIDIANKKGLTVVNG